MATANGTQYFANAKFSNSDVIPTITHVNGDVYNVSSPERYGLKLLLENISKGASHDAAERGDPPQCHPRTRTAIRAEIMEWIQAPNAMRKLILWIYGPAGSGKTSILQTIAEACKEQGLLGASFFFGRTAAERNDASRFVATIAFQLYRSIPKIRERIILAVEQDPTIFSLALALQVQALVVEPLKSLPPSLTPIVVITDGLDECGPSRESPAHLLNALGSAISELQHIPLLFLIASRPELDIREAFNGDLLNPLFKSLVLDDKYKPDEDIKLYLDHMFKEIHARHLRLGNTLPSTWPKKKDVDSLVSKASGQFIFVATVMRFVNSLRHYPPERLKIILDLSKAKNETPFAQLDALYIFILSSAADIQKVLEIFAVLIFGSKSRSSSALTVAALSVEAIEALLGFQQGVTIGTVLVDMHALVFVPPPTDRKSPLRIHHASLYDFLMDQSRSKDYYIDAKLAHNNLSQRWLKIMANYPDIPVPFSLDNCVDGFVRHYKLSPKSSEIEGDLASFRLRKILDKISGYDDLHHVEWEDFLDCVETNAGHRVDVFPRLRDEFDAFVLERLSRYPQALQVIILVHDTATRHTRQCVFHISLYDMYPSPGLDLTLLDICHSGPCDRQEFRGYGRVFGTLFCDRTRAGKFHVDGGSYLTWAKQIFQIIYYPMLRPAKHRPEFFHDSMPYVFNYRFGNILEAASEDLELAVLLRERTLQYLSDAREFGKELRIVAEASLSYVKRCGIPHKIHSHPAHTDRCVICAWEGTASDTEMSPWMPESRITRISILDRLAFVMRRYIHFKLSL